MTLSTCFYRRGNVRLAYDRAGDGPLLVFLHGVGGNRSNWRGELGRLSGSYCCVAWDARGYGDSDDPDRKLVFDDFANDLAALLDHLGAERAHIVGLSMGGFIAQSFYTLYPERVATLTLAATSAGAKLLTVVAREEFLDIRLKPLEEGRSIADIAAGLVGVLAGERADAAVREQLRLSLEALRPESYKQALRALVTTDFRAALPSIKAPTLVVTGNDDRVFALSESHHLADQIRDSRLTIIEGAGHLCNLEAPEEFSAALSQFLLSHSNAGASVIGGKSKT
ncbi:3-oxoadipate enol-lactonase 2 [Paraburkholderia domus]|uniref:alpha/beta fold hydrolase n=1 Tax=Paraburkholderia domus TaxID=2793075 RepID=UPI001911B133|nr:alpha/beta fold hydrolase [Paraburkholderia domus]MBK5050489.1 alpha/beta fold hydrolase [Burkholderia sp. R-70006]CAE6753969.1 3-oxoadipate enol-lactonase 2 [Paraburkholderia domus]